ncbi:FtsX-like permease family protein [Aeoliella sp. ICT_H6.2]|uniref:FtsX-like permease family protein n=1 Tax=Aeoliella straminimaris TaxID=2954799 RepID=A0A9X2F7G1_9BACT|nr:FtsX-like permease family protein [Aeoliella straminimaris]MCO6043757.1 FtsX-like permease family protein [Aeoliella straminimaris]
MYKLLLCWRYLRTRYIALASIISVTLGVATMIVVNSVMDGFAHEMQGRMNDVLSDVIITSRSLEGMANPEWHMAEIRKVAGDDVVGMTPTAQVPAALAYYFRGQYFTRQVTVIGIDPETYSSVSKFGYYLQHPENREHLDFQLKEDGYDVMDHQAEDMRKVKPREQMKQAGWKHRRANAEFEKRIAVQPPIQTAAQENAAATDDSPFATAPAPVQETFDPATEQHAGTVLGIGLCSHRTADGTDVFQLLPGDDVEIHFPSCGRPPEFRSSKLTVTDFYESKMAQYDMQYMFIPLDKFQEMRGMIDPQSGIRFVNAIQIKLAEGADLNAVRDKLREHFQLHLYDVSTWRDMEGPLLAAVQTETLVLNVLLFLIIAVAGFGILAIFFMIVVEKTRDIGILKSLGASSEGVMGIFLTYGFSLGIVGAGLGIVGGLLFVKYINEIADLLGRATGTPVFDPAVYYLYKIPTIVEPFTVGWIAIGAMLIAVLASVLPAIRAAKMHPVQALRFE